ncbi:hypothetical protein [Amycolatopsis alba]|uniref:Uncharacterized protein n=1 Tax=Amycolatopsis alba DSM 44262 TaxID=1125972 RepID=A0A229S7I4_AMYAL|nr:hypothetical protein [Amycolatopsis alba]OXM54912.1 hypothetical protein CFP75_01850 [Amycolatopsis alba DSM 44262]
MTWLTPVLALVAGLLTAGAAFFGVRVTVRQKEQSESRSEWRARFQMAQELYWSSDAEKRLAGLGIFDVLAESDLAGPDELRMIEVFLRPILQQPQQAEEPENGGSA